MIQLVHAIFATNDTELAAAGGWERPPRTLVTEGRLTAACSSEPAAPSVPTASQLLAYSGRVNELFSQVNVLPLRYGCWLAGEQEIRQLLSRRDADFQALLQRIRGCVEMAISILPSDRDAACAPRFSDRAAAAADAVHPGLLYIRARQRHYALDDDRKAIFERTVQNIQTALTGLFVSSVAEQRSAGSARLWSLYFLVRRDANERFRHAFSILQNSLQERLLLSGPWPPYNFVCGKQSESLS